jgi:predicted nucleic acid-binding protein
LQTDYVVDTNVLVQWLLNPAGLTGSIIRSLELQLFTPYQAIGELWEHKRDWSRKNPIVNLSDFTSAMEYYVQIVYPPFDPNAMKAAKSIMDPRDPGDTEFLALAIAKRADIWSQDAHFDNILGTKRVVNKDILNRSHEIPTLWEALRSFDR